jgi:hypothetical protein
MVHPFIISLGRQIPYRLDNPYASQSLFEYVRSLFFTTLKIMNSGNLPPAKLPLTITIQLCKLSAPFILTDQEPHLT